MKYEERKQQIMRAALRLFAEQGYHATSVSDIIEEIGVARGTFYRYFRDKHDLFDQLLENNFRYVKRVLPEAPLGHPAQAPDLEVLLTTAFQELIGQPNSREFMSMMVNDAGGADAAFAQKVNAFYDDVAEVFGKYIETARDAGLIGPRDPKVAAYLVLGALKEIFIQWAKGGKFEDLELLIREVSSFIVGGVRPGT